MPAPEPENTSEMYLRWRDSVMPRDTDFFDFVPEMSREELVIALERAMPGFTAERLNPSKSTGDFHYACGVLRGFLYAKTK